MDIDYYTCSCCNFLGYGPLIGKQYYVWNKYIYFSNVCPDCSQILDIAFASCHI